MVTPSLMDIEDALTLMRRELAPVDTGAETLPLESARGRVLASDLATAIDVPPFAASSMDGYAVASDDPVFRAGIPAELVVDGESYAGAGDVAPLGTNCARRIFTGAPLPPRADAVVMQEDCERHAGHVVINGRPEAGLNVRPAGHDVATGSLLATAGTWLHPFQLARLASCGIDSVPVRRPLRVAVFSTGDELRDPGEPLGPGEIYDANRLAIKSLLAEMPLSIVDLGIVRDDVDAIRRVLGSAAARADVLLTSGGVSVGDADHVRDVVEEIGSLRFWRLAIKPGKPIAHGRVAGAVFFGLPGNPVSTIVTLLMVVKPALWTLAGAEPMAPVKLPAILAERIVHHPGRAEYQRGTFVQKDGRTEVRPSGDQSSNRLSSFQQANCLICVPRHSGTLEAGAPVDVLPFYGIIG